MARSGLPGPSKRPTPSTRMRPIKIGKPPVRDLKPLPKPSIPKIPKISEIDRYLAGDSVYQGILRGSKRTLGDFLSELGRRRSESTTQYGTTKKNLERDRAEQLQNIRDEFASRGIIQSGLFGKEQGTFQEKFSNQMNELMRQQTGLMGDLTDQERNFKREQEIALEAARQEALQRRAAKLGLK